MTFSVSILSYRTITRNKVRGPTRLLSRDVQRDIQAMKRYHQMYLRASEAQTVPLTVASCLADKEIRLCRLKGKTREKEAKAGNKYLPHLCLRGLVPGWVIV